SRTALPTSENSRQGTGSTPSAKKRWTASSENAPNSPWKPTRGARAGPGDSVFATAAFMDRPVSGRHHFGGDGVGEGAASGLGEGADLAHEGVEGGEGERLVTIGEGLLGAGVDLDD